LFDAMLEKATRLCEAAFGLMSTYDGEQYHTVATHGVGPELVEFMRAPPHPDPESALGRIGGAGRSHALSGTGSPREDSGTRVRLSCRLYPPRKSRPGSIEAHRRYSSLLTRRWRIGDSNSRSPRRRHNRRDLPQLVDIATDAARLHMRRTVERLLDEEARMELAAE
jgi:hypothetical protein